MQLNTTSAQGSVQLPAQRQAQDHKILKMVHNERMAGSIPSWQPATSQTERIAADMSSAALNSYGKPSAQSALALQEANGATKANSPQEFGFKDLLDMVNPLHHIPIIGTLYRELSGDQIRPVSRLIGGGMFGGVAGLASGLINIIAEEETGRDLTGNALHFASSGESPRFKDPPPQINNLANNPEKALENAIAERSENKSGSTASMLAFVDQAYTSALSTRSSIPQKVAFREL